MLQKLRGVNRVDKELSGIRVSIASEKVGGTSRKIYVECNKYDSNVIKRTELVH